MQTFEARYAGECAECGGRIAPGDEVAWRGSRSERGEVVHAACPERLDVVRAGETRCSRCTSIHVGEC